MKLENYKTHQFNTTLMSVIKSVLEYFNYIYSDELIFGSTGHAFLINIHNRLCPSGPYCWKYEGFYKLLNGLGIDMQDLGFFHSQSTSKQRKIIEHILKEKIKNNLPCSLINLENQIIYGFNENHFLLGQQWKDEPEITPATLTYKTWKELGSNYHVTFFTYNKIEPADELTIIINSIRYAIDLNENSQKYELNKEYSIGLNAYDNWEKGIEEYGNSHGNWWNSIVWSECRKMASLYFAEISEKLNKNSKEINSSLSKRYLEISEILQQIGNNEININERINLIRKAKQIETECLNNLKGLINIIST
jgi:hypothetical protein